jgi:hypothetical protein
MLTEFFATAHIEAAARRTGFVQRTSKITGKIFLALVTFGVWSDAKTTCAQLAAKATQLDEPVAVSPEALYQRMHKRAHAFLQEMIQHALAKTPAIDTVCEEAFCAAFPKVYLADRTGFALPDSLKETFPGSGGVRQKPGQKFKRCGTIKTAGLIISPSPHGTCRIRNISTKSWHWRQKVSCCSLIEAILRSKRSHTLRLLAPLF